MRVDFKIYYYLIVTLNISMFTNLASKYQLQSAFYIVSSFQLLNFFAASIQLLLRLNFFLISKSPPCYYSAILLTSDHLLLRIIFNLFHLIIFVARKIHSSTCRPILCLTRTVVDATFPEFHLGFRIFCVRSMNMYV